MAAVNLAGSQVAVSAVANTRVKINTTRSIRSQGGLDAVASGCKIEGCGENHRNGASRPAVSVYWLRRDEVNTTAAYTAPNNAETVVK